MASGGAKSFDPHQLYDVSAKERQIIEARRENSARLKKEFQKKSTNPFRSVGGYIFDPSVQRFMSMRANHFEMFRPNPKNASFAFFALIFPIGLFYYLNERDRLNLDKKCRTGQIAYKDRLWKFI